MASPTKTSACTFLSLVSRSRMGEHAADLRVAATAVDLLHQGAEHGGIRDEPRGSAFGQAAVVEELDVDARRSKPPRGTCRPAGGRPRPRSAAGSWWRRGQRSAVRAGTRLHRRRQRPGAGEERVDLRAGGDRRSARRRPVGIGVLSERSFAISAVRFETQRMLLISGNLRFRRNCALPSIGDDVVQIERLVDGGEPFGARRRAPPALFVDRQLQALEQRAHFLPGGDVRQVRPCAEGRSSN